MSGVMAFLGLPTKEDIQGAIGYVTDEDRERWDAMEKKVQAQREQATGDMAKGASMVPQQAMNARMRAAEQRDADEKRQASGEQVSVTRWRVREGEGVKDVPSDDYEYGG